MKIICYQSQTLLFKSFKNAYILLHIIKHFAGLHIFKQENIYTYKHTYILINMVMPSIHMCAYVFITPSYTFACPSFLKIHMYVYFYFAQANINFFKRVARFQLVCARFLLA